MKMIDYFRPRLSDLEPVATCSYPDGPFVATDVRPCVRCGTEHSWDGLHPVLCADCKTIRLPVVPHRKTRKSG